MKYRNSTLFKCQLKPKLSGLDFYHIKYVPVILITLILCLQNETTGICDFKITFDDKEKVCRRTG